MTAYEMAKTKEYYPKLWPIDRLNTLLKANKLSQEEYNDLISSTNKQEE